MSIYIHIYTYIHTYIHMSQYINMYVYINEFLKTDYLHKICNVKNAYTYIHTYLRKYVSLICRNRAIINLHTYTINLYTYISLTFLNSYYIIY